MSVHNIDFLMEDTDSAKVQRPKSPASGSDAGRESKNGETCTVREAWDMSGSTATSSNSESYVVERGWTSPSFDHHSSSTPQDAKGESADEELKPGQ